MDFKRVAIQAAKKAGRIHKKYYHGKAEVKEKGSSFDLVTNVDIEAEKCIVGIIRKFFPDHNFLGEEEKYEKTSSEYTWVIDPLDGTNNYAYGIPLFCVSIALARGEEVILGVVYDMIHDELFTAEKGKGARLNGRKISVSTVDTMQKAMLVTGFYYNRGSEMETNLDNIKKFFEMKIMGMRRLGSAALDLCYVACGRTTGFFEFALSPWDFAAGLLLVHEAGGRVTNEKGRPVALEKSYIVATNGKIHDEVLKVLNR